MRGPVALLTPVPLGAPQGNAVTVARVARGLAARGLDVEVLQASGEEPPLLRGGAAPPRLVHAFHAYRTGRAGWALARALGIPLVVTVTGTDASSDLSDAGAGAAVRAVLRAAAAVTVFDRVMAPPLRGAVPSLDGRLVVVPQGVTAAAPVAPDPELHGAPCLFFPAGLRPVKRPRLALQALDGLAQERPGLRLWHAGPPLDAGEAQAFAAALAARPWARYLGAVPHARMPALLQGADVVLNCSRSEGGMANSVLEAMAQGRAVLASDIPGNRSLVEPGRTGLLFRSEAELAARVRELADDPALRRRLGEAGRRLVTTRYTPEIEAEGYLALYRRLLGRGAAG
jgi:glycosyltransferase involved in cell wall biosynthesis